MIEIAKKFITRGKNRVSKKGHVIKRCETKHTEYIDEKKILDRGHCREGEEKIGCMDM